MALQPHLIGLVLLAAAAHAVWNALVKVSGERLLTFAAIVRRDMIDVQSFMWVQGAPEYAA